MSDATEISIVNDVMEAIEQYALEWVEMLRDGDSEARKITRFEARHDLMESLGAAIDYAKQKRGLQ